MQLLFVYLLKSAFCLALGYLFYFLLLRRMTWYNWNRYFLLAFPVAALVIPLLPVRLPGNAQAFKAGFFLTDALPAVAQTASINIIEQGVKWNLVSIAFLVLLAGVIFFLLRFMLRLYSLYSTRSAAKLVNDGDIKLYHLEGCAAPFSFYNSIYLDINHYDEGDKEKIIEHELVHIRQKHTVDMILSELLCIIQWFNPFAWLMKHAMRQNLEFIADDSVLQKGINRKGYQYLLLKVSGAVPYSLANNLLFPSLKKRIHMMNRTKTTKIHLLKFMCIVPLGCILLFSFSGQTGKPPAYGAVNTSAENFSLGSLSFYINDENVAALLKNDQANSFLKAGGPLSLSLISEEKARIKTLLEKNGYNNLNSHAITFIMDTSAANHSFSVQVTIHLDKNQRSIHQLNKNPTGVSAADMAAAEKETQYIIAPDEPNPEKITATRSRAVSRPPNAADRSVAMK